MAPDALVYKVAFQAIEKHLKQGIGVVLDGAIRSLEQARVYQKFFTDHGWENEVMAIEVALPDEEIWQRMESRLRGGSDRPDDNTESMKRRIIEQGNAALRSITDYYNTTGVLKQVDGKKSITEVAREIEQVLGIEN